MTRDFYPLLLKALITDASAATSRNIHIWEGFVLKVVEGGDLHGDEALGVVDGVEAHAVEAHDVEVHGVGDHGVVDGVEAHAVEAHGVEVHGVGVHGVAVHEVEAHSS
mmetsp:Transcript_53312/g.85015  ORF Transcript_53312/g.85015 Transcript_53312/m.85015 type:complete len:108 (-) Transcript_53312:77-400(-)